MFFPDVPLDRDDTIQPMINTTKHQNTQHAQHDQRCPTDIGLCDFHSYEEFCEKKIENERGGAERGDPV
jgi:hypothetical protein